MTGVGAADFAVTGTAATVTNVSGSGTQYDVTVSGGNLATLNGTVGLNFAASPTISDLAGNALPYAEPAIDATYTLVNVALPASSFRRQSPVGSRTNADSLDFRATFGGAVTDVDLADFVATGTTGTVTQVVAVSATEYDVRIAGDVEESGGQGEQATDLVSPSPRPPLSPSPALLVPRSP